MSDSRFITHIVNGPEGMVRNLFANRQLKGAPAIKIFPGVPNVAILPTEFDGETEAIEYLQPLLTAGGNAAAVKEEQTLLVRSAGKRVANGLLDISD